MASVFFILITYFLLLILVFGLRVGVFDGDDIKGDGLAFFVFAQTKDDDLTFAQGLVTWHLDGRKVNKNFGIVGRINEAVAACFTKPLDMTDKFDG
jgi:hypothetical protein